MAIEKKLPLSLEEISLALGVSSTKLQKFLANQNKDTTLVVNEVPPALKVIDEYHTNLKELVRNNKRSVETWTTYNNFIKRIKSYLYDNCPNIKINELNEIILNQIIRYNSKTDKVYATKTINKYCTIMKSIMTFAFESNYTQKDLSYKFKTITTSLLPRYIQDEDIVQILKTVETLPKATRCKAMIIFLLGTGCRVSEISKIKVKDFDINNNVIFIHKSKGNKDRYIPMFDDLKNEILEYLKNSGMESWDSKCEGFLFARDEGTERKRNFPIRTIEHLIERIRNKIPHLSKITPHTFRHTFAVKCLKIGISFHHLTLILGHTDPKTTMIYTQLYNVDLKEQIIKKFPFPFEDLLNQVFVKNSV